MRLSKRLSALNSPSHAIVRPQTARYAVSLRDFWPFRLDFLDSHHGAQSYRLVHFEIQKLTDWSSCEAPINTPSFFILILRFPFSEIPLLSLEPPENKPRILLVPEIHLQPFSSTMASFISKLSEECNKCKDIIDHCVIKALRFESDSSIAHQILGPMFKKHVPSSITDLMRENCLTPLRQGFEWPKWDASKPQKAWPLTSATWAAWVDRLEKFFCQEWRALGIYDAIRLSTVEITMDKELLMAALSFWCSATNTMTFPLGPIGPTVLDISAILGTSLLVFPSTLLCLGVRQILTLRHCLTPGPSRH